MNPYSSLPKESFWRTGVAEASPFYPTSIFTKKWEIGRQDKIATAGSCFAQHISRNMRNRNFHVIDEEPAPRGLPSHLHGEYGYSMYSARYGNIYTSHQLAQLAKEAILDWKPSNAIWHDNDGRYFDAFRPNIEPTGLSTQEEVATHRREHLKNVKQLFHDMDIFIFTFGLTEGWIDRESGTVYPTAPGVIAGNFEEDKFQFKNFNYIEVMDSFLEFLKIVKEFRNKKKFTVLLTVSPVPLTATATGGHVLPATVYSKSVLRAVAGDLSNSFDEIDYFPSYEIITNQTARSEFFEKNFRSIRPEGVATVMNVFFSQFDAADMQVALPIESESSLSKLSNEDDLFEDKITCEDELLEKFSR